MAIEITGNEQWQAWQAGVLPPVEQVADDLWSIPVPIPDNPLRYVLVYALACRDGLVLIDAGWDDEISWRALTDGIGAIGYDIRDVRAVLVTHHHPDHIGLAGRVREASGAWIALHSLDVNALARAAESPEWLMAALLGHLEVHGTPAEDVRRAAAGLQTRRLTGAPVADVHLEDGESIKLPGLELRVVWTPGHSPGHSCFYQPDRQRLFSGDHVLPRITPQIAVHRPTTDDPLGDFLRSLTRLETLAVDEVLPAHEYRFRGLDQRLTRLAEHHSERLVELYGAVRAAPGSTAWELSAGLAWSRPWSSFDVLSRRFALGETVAHLTLLANRREVHRAAAAPVRWYPGPAS